jgi:transcriptional regulator with XRE-family HTH domain
MALDELRAARKITQEHLAKILRVKQSSISKMEHRTDMYLSTLADFIRAMGGKLEIRAVFADGIVKIEGFGEIEEKRKSASWLPRNSIPSRTRSAAVSNSRL